MEQEVSVYPVFRGLQKPLEFMGIRGRFITLSAILVGASFLGFLAFSTIFGRLGGFISLLVILGTGLLYIFIKQKQGLHNKKRDNCLVFFHHMYKH